VNYLSLAEAFVLGQLVTGIDAVVLESASRTELLDSALHAPQAGFGEDDFYSDFFMKAAVLCTRIARNHPLPDGNKRLAWICLVTFCDVNGYELFVAKEEAVRTVVAVAAGDLSEDDLCEWISRNATKMI
jgi:death-on-curing protein